MPDGPLDNYQLDDKTTTDSDIQDGSEISGDIDADISDPMSVAEMQVADPLPRLEPFGPGDKEAAFWNDEADAIEDWAQSVPGGPDGYIDNFNRQMGWKTGGGESENPQLDSQSDSLPDLSDQLWDGDIGEP